MKFADLQRELGRPANVGWASAPVYDANSQIIAALSVSGPSCRLGRDQFEEAAKQTIAAVDALSRRLGWVERG